MALNEENNGMGTTMLVGPANNGGFGGFGGTSDLLVILFLFAMFGGGFGGYGGYGNNQLSYDFPWLMNGQNAINDNTNAQFAQAATQAALSDISTQLCGGFGSVNANITNSFAQAEIAENARQMAYTNQMFGIQNAITVGIQSVKDQMCADKIEAKNDIISQLRSELMYARGQASQDVQTATIQAGQRALANEVEQYVAPKAIPAYIVQNPACACNNGYNCGV